VADGTGSVGRAFEDTLVDELGEARREKVRGAPERRGEVVEAPDAEEGVSQDENRPPVPDHGQGASDGAGEIADGVPAHWIIYFKN